jgi:hypothetical protein
VEADRDRQSTPAVPPERRVLTQLRFAEIATAGAGALLLISILGSWASWKPDISVDYGSALATGSAERVMIGLLLVFLAVVVVVYRVTTVPRPRLFFTAVLIGLIAFIIRATYSYDGSYSMNATPLMYLAWVAALALVIAPIFGFIVALRVTAPVSVANVGPSGLQHTESDSRPAAEQRTVDMTSDDGEKACPDCAEMVKFAARVCRYCGFKFPSAATIPDSA